MIKSFKHKGLEKLFTLGDRRFLDAQQAGRLEILLDALEQAEVIEDMNLPGLNLHKLTGNKKDTWSLKVSGNWRLTFKFEDGEAFEINLEDYH